MWVGKKADGGVDQRPKGGYPGGSKMKPRAGLDAEMYEQLRQEILERKGAK